MKTLEKLLNPKGLLAGALIAGAVLFPNYQANASEDGYGASACNKTIGINAVLQGVIGGIGGLQNGKPFWSSFYKSAVGGALQGVGKCMVAQDLDSAWPAKFVNAFGTSISDSVAQGKGMADAFGIDYGPLYLEWTKEDGWKPYLLAENLAAMAYARSKGYNFDSRKTVKYGTPVYTTKELSTPEDFRRDRNREGMKFIVSNVVLLSESADEPLVSHELIHAHQYSASSSLGQVVMSIPSQFREEGDKVPEPPPEWLYFPKFAGSVTIEALQVNDSYVGKPTEQEAHRLTGR